MKSLEPFKGFPGASERGLAIAAGALFLILSSLLSFDHLIVLFFSVLGVIGLVILYKMYKSIFKAPFSLRKKIICSLVTLVILGFFYYVMVWFYLTMTDWDYYIQLIK